MGDQDIALDGNHKWKEVLFLVGVYLAMILGMLAKTYFDHLTKGSELNKKQFIVPLLVSPLIYGTVFRAVKGTNEPVIMLIFGFQNGFFWQDVFGQITEDQ